MQTRVFIGWSPTCIYTAIIFAITLIPSFRIPAAGDEVVGGKPLVSHGTSSTDECWGTYDSTAQAGWGPSFQNSCIYSGSNDYSGGNTVWYNYTIASAGTIFDENTSLSNPAINTSPATESICPKGWTLPSKTQIDSNRDVSNFYPVLGGYYTNSTLQYEATVGFLWGSESKNSNGTKRLFVYYDGNTLSTGDGNRYSGLYVRCVVKKNTKTLSNLTYMQDMTSPLDYSEW